MVAEGKRDLPQKFHKSPSPTLYPSPLLDTGPLLSKYRYYPLRMKGDFELYFEPQLLQKAP